MRRHILTAAAAVIALAVASPAAARSILFVGNSFTYGQGSAVVAFHPERVRDLNGYGIGGVPALFKTFAQQAGQDWDVALETSGGRTLAWHLAEKRPMFEQPWDVVVLQGQSVLDPNDPGNPTAHIAAANEIGRLVHAAKGSARLLLMGTWTSAPWIYAAGARTSPKPSPWIGKTVYSMAEDLQAASERALKDGQVAAVLPIGLAWNRAMRDGVADPNPYDGLAFGQVSLWTWDFHHASAEGYYLEALVVFGAVTGVDPTTLGAREAAAAELGLNPDTVVKLQAIAKAELAKR